MTAVWDRTSGLSAFSSAALHALLIFILGWGAASKHHDLFQLQEIALLPAGELGAGGLGGFRDLTRPGGDSAEAARVQIRDPGAKKEIPKGLQHPLREQSKPAGPSRAQRQQALKDAMRKIQDQTRRELLGKEGSGPVLSHEDSEALEGSEGGGGPSSVAAGPEAGGSGPAVSGRGEGDGGVMLTGGIATRGIRRKPLPDYPAWARERGIEGVVVLEITVLESGLLQADGIRVVQTSGFRDMDLSVQQALRDWEFVPLPEGSGPQTGRISFRFKLTSGT